MAESQFNVNSSQSTSSSSSEKSNIEFDNNNVSNKSDPTTGDKRSNTFATDQSITGADAKKSKVDPASLPTRQYLDSTVVPILLDGLAALARARPDQPIDFLIDFLQKHKQEFEKWRDRDERLARDLLCAWCVL